MMIGLIALTGATVILCLTRVFWLFIIGRLLQGISAAAVWTVGLALITDSFPEEHIGKMMGIVGTGMSLGGFLGPLLGGVLYDRAGYYSVFGLCFGFIAADIFFRVFMLEKKDLKLFKSAEPDTENAQAEIEQIYEVSESSPQEEEANETSTAADAAGATAKKSKVPVTIRLLLNKRMANGLFLTIILGWVLTGLETTLPLRSEEIFNFNTLGAGMLFLPIAITSMLGPLVGWWSDKYGARYPLGTGFFLATPFIILLRLPDDDRVSQIVLMFALLTLFGLAVSMMLPSAMAEISTVVTDAEASTPGIFGKGGAYGQAFGLFNLAYSAGSVIGPLEAGFVVDAHGFKTMSWTLGVVSFVASIPAFMFTGGYIFGSNGKAKSDTDSVEMSTHSEEIKDAESGVLEVESEQVKAQ